MGIDLLENNELSPLNTTRGEPFFNVGALTTTILIKKFNLKKIRGKVGSATEATPEFKAMMRKLYAKISAGADRKAKARAQIEGENGVEAVFQVSKRFGQPKDTKTLDLHNIYVSNFLKYFIPTETDEVQDCENLTLVLAAIDIDIKADETKGSQGARAAAIQASVQSLAERKREFETLYLFAKCDVKKEEAQAGKEKEQLMSEIDAATGGGAASKKSNNMLYIGAGVVVLIGIFLLIRRK